MKKTITFLCMHLLCIASALSQGAAINTTGDASDPSAILDVSSSSQGMLIPRLTTEQRDAIPSPAEGLLIFDTTTKCFESYVEGAWNIISCPSPCNSGAVISGNANVCEQSSETYSVAINNATGYLWYYTDINGTYISDVHSNPVSLYFDYGASSGILTVIGTNTCGSVSNVVSASFEITMNYLPLQPNAIYGNTSSCPGSSETYSVDYTEGVTYNWNFPPDWVQTDGGTTNTVTVTVGSSSGDIFVTPSTPCGDGPYQTLYVLTAAAPPSAATNYPAETQIQWNWNAVPGALGYKYNTSDDYATATDNGTNTGYAQTGLACGTSNTLYVWSYNECGNSESNALSQTTSACCSANAWLQLTPAGGPPAARYDQSAVWDLVNNKMYVFGGEGSSGNRNDLWSYTPSTNTWAPVIASGGPPATRRGHTSVWDPSNNRILVFGGCCNYSDLWAYTPATNTWAEIHPVGSPLPGLRFHAATWDAANNRMLVFGGEDNTIYVRVNTLYSYTPATNTWAQLTPSGTPPSARTAHTTVWDSSNNRMLVFGGSNGGNLNDIWSYTPAGNAWLQLSPAGGPPSARRDHSAVWDASNNRMLVFSGNGLNDLWSFSGNTWTSLNPGGSLPVERESPSAVWNASNNRMLIFGGYGSSYRNDIWQYCP